MSSSLRLSCTCGNTEILSNNMEKFQFSLIKFSPDSKTGKMRIICKACGQETEDLLIGNN